MAIVIENDHTAEVLAKIKEGIRRALDESGNIVASAAREKAPVDTGRLRNSITHQVVGDDECQIGTDVYYGKYLECKRGKGRREFLKPAILESTGKIESAFRNNIS